jgi:hypothetical protein
MPRNRLILPRQGRLGGKNGQNIAFLGGSTIKNT